MKDFIYKIKYLNKVVYSSRGSLLDLQLSRICLASTKKNVKYDKNQINLLSFFVKTGVEVSNVITLSFKK